MLFLRLLICLSSAGNLARSEVRPGRPAVADGEPREGRVAGPSRVAADADVDAALVAATESLADPARPWRRLPPRCAHSARPECPTWGGTPPRDAPYAAVVVVVDDGRLSTAEGEDAQTDVPPA